MSPLIFFGEFNLKLSRYTKIYAFDGNSGHQVLYSTLTGSVTLVEDDVYKGILSGTLSSAEVDTLTEEGFIVEDLDKEKLEVFEILTNMNASNTRFNLITVINLDCNLACTYCYEGNMKGRLYMTDETADALVDFISRSLNPKIKTLNIDFYGGEPLLSAELIKRISRKLQELAEQRELKYGFTLVTNGTLFTRRTAEELGELGLKRVKITLDGPRASHDSHRPFKSGKGSFESIIANIKEVCEVTDIGIGGNYNKDNYGLFPELLDCLIAEGLTPEKIATVKFDPIMGSGKHNAGGTDFRDGCESSNELWLREASLYLREEILKRGFNTPEISASTCMVNIQDSHVINYDGSIYKCPGLIGKKEFEVGHVREGVADYSGIYNLDMWKNEKCTDCEYLPLCFGGCRYLKYIQDGNINGVECRKDYFDATLEAFVMQDIKYRLLK